MSERGMSAAQKHAERLATMRAQREANGPQRDSGPTVSYRERVKTMVRQPTLFPPIKKKKNPLRKSIPYHRPPNIHRPPRFSYLPVLLSGKGVK